MAWSCRPLIAACSTATFASRPSTKERQARGSGYSWAFNGPPGESARRFAECQKLAPSPVDKTVAELRQIFDRWVKERDCLVRLGYAPVLPPSFEEFVVGWRTTGPWMPVDGIDYTTWTTAEYDAVKLQCTLEAYER